MDSKLIFTTVLASGCLLAAPADTVKNGSGEQPLLNVASDASCCRDRVLLRLILGQNVLEAWKDDRANKPETVKIPISVGPASGKAGALCQPDGRETNDASTRAKFRRNARSSSPS
jgi:hypothetical protein